MSRIFIFRRTFLNPAYCTRMIRTRATSAASNALPSRLLDTPIFGKDNVKRHAFQPRAILEGLQGLRIFVASGKHVGYRGPPPFINS